MFFILLHRTDDVSEKVMSLPSFLDALASIVTEVDEVNYTIIIYDIQWPSSYETFI